MRKSIFNPVNMVVFLSLQVLVAISPVKVYSAPLDQEKIAELAVQLHDDMSSISAAYEKYRAKHGTPPDGIDALVSGGIMTSIPTIGAELGECKYEFVNGYDDMDGKGKTDVAIYTTSCVPTEICQEFNRRYAAAPLNDGTIFDYQAAGKSYPGKVYGLQMKVYAIKWLTTDETCELNWVLEYK